ncbi:hypothetical protein [Alteromonas abrolhosensis]|uniref:hypothetical protein n=1 Tax=Alteromonas abrolhosensis TaxID=1892904 RepID=UPI00096B8D0B|nr:hypothetical protein [Alteromonas abrolhosensis]|tara:strand:+ start:2276 stop:2626 length:351 start_codon:yes stop_codon:yes gene_type:complete
MSSAIDTKHGKLLAEMVVQSSSWKIQPEKQDPFKSQEAAVEYLNSHNEPLYLHVPLAQSDDYVRICVTSRDDYVVFTIKDINNGGETSLHYSHIKNLDSTIRTLVSETCDQKIKAL